MRQQINLYQPIFRAERRIFSSRTIAFGVVTITVALIGLWAYGNWKVGRLEREVTRIAQQGRLQAANLATGSAALAAQANPAEIESRIKALSEELDRRARALAALRSGAGGTTEGFAPRLEALARRRIDGLWLEGISFGGAGRSMSVAGATVDSRLVPRYLEELQQEPALSGARFDHVEIGEPPVTAGKAAAAPLLFRLSDSRLEHKRPANAGS
ncbi:MAG TPA: PilN domain-containing protein [Steroidobacteraceae bacterium]|nr:PilN domain-containing protein [Steroidobacteraceae bacterium]